MPHKGVKHFTPDGRYFVVRGRLWRLADPSLSEADRERCVLTLMAARRAVLAAKRAGDETGEAAAHAAVDRAKRALGERGPVWWTDGAPDLNRRMVRNSPYADWYAKEQLHRGDAAAIPNGSKKKKIRNDDVAVSNLPRSFR